MQPCSQCATLRETLKSLEARVALRDDQLKSKAEQLSVG